MSGITAEIYRSIVNSLDEALFLVNPDGTLMELNDIALAFTGLSSKQVVGRPLGSLLPPEPAEYLIQQGRNALTSGKERIIKKKAVIFPGKGFRFYSIRINPIRPVGKAPFLALFLRDITARVRHETANEKARENAEAEAGARQAFLARMSHEIRTPMNGIMGMTDLALQSDPPGEVGEYLGVIKSAAESLLAIINDVLDFAKFESGRTQLENLPIRLRHHLEEIITLLQPAADEKGIRLTSSFQKSLPDLVFGDPTRLRQILINLIGNAIKFTNEGSVHVYLEEIPPPPEASAHELILAGTVIDSGIGINPEQLESLFDPFVQENSSVSREFGGTGLGLAICRSLAELMDGSLEAESVPGEGSTFRFQVILKKPPTGEKLPGNAELVPENIHWNGEKILLAEDNRVNRRVAEKLLEKAGFTVVQCSDGKQAVRLSKREKPALILMDIQMPVMGGLEATQIIRRYESQENLRPVPIIALTAHVLEDERRITGQAGMNGWVGKPFRPAELFRELARFIPPVLKSNNESSQAQGKHR